MDGVVEWWGGSTVRDEEGRPCVERVRALGRCHGGEGKRVRLVVGDRVGARGRAAGARVSRLGRHEARRS